MGEARRGLLLLAALISIAVGASACESSSSDDGRGVDPTPERIDGSSSDEFEPEDIDAANSASQAVQDYCAGADSEAQYVGCLSHVDEDDIP